jgi:imidazoleglycerol phosphate synthase glutamine amidotransferase subunit HisH
LCWCRECLSEVCTSVSRLGGARVVERVVVEHSQEYHPQIIVSDDKETIRNAEKVIFPGVGEASSAMKYLKEMELDKLIVSLKQPVLGICLGQQLMCNFSEEGNTNCLGIFDNNIK